MKNYELNTISVRDVLHTLRECDRNERYEGMFDHMLTFASELTGISEDTLMSELYQENTLPTTEKKSHASSRGSKNKPKFQYYDKTVAHLCESLNKAEEKDAEGEEYRPRAIEDFIPMFMSTNYFGIYYYNGDNEYYLVDRTTGEHTMVLGDSFEFVGKNMLDCMKDEQILHVANTEFLGYLVHFSLDNVNGYFSYEDLTGIAVLEDALRTEKIKKTGGYYLGPSLLEKIQSAKTRAATPSDTKSAPLKEAEHEI